MRSWSAKKWVFFWWSLGSLFFFLSLLSVVFWFWQRSSLYTLVLSAQLAGISLCYFVQGFKNKLVDDTPRLPVMRTVRKKKP